MVTPHTEEYLEAILRLACPDNKAEAPCLRPEVDIASLDRKRCHLARPSEIAELVGVSRPSVTTALQRMELLGLITRDNKGVRLTDSGFIQAREVLRRHRVAERFLVNVLGFDAQSVHDEACVLEHALSDRIVDALEEYVMHFEDDSSNC